MEAETKPSLKVLSEPWKYDISYHRFVDFLGLDKYKRDNQGIAEKVALVYDWAKEIVGRDDITAIMSAVNAFQRDLGTNAIGETLLNILHRNIRLDMTGQTPTVPKKKKVEKKEEKKKEVSLLDKGLEKTMKPIKKKIQKEVKERIKTTIDESVSAALRETLGGE